jgi:hypothetical protein
MAASRPDDFDEVVLSARAGRQLHIGDTIALCVQRGGKTYCVSSEGFVELSCRLREVGRASTLTQPQPRPQPRPRPQPSFQPRLQP